MEPISIAAIAALVMKYVGPAIREFGEQVLDKSTDAASDGAVGFGRRLLHTLLPGRPHADQPALEAAVERRVVAVANDTDASKASIQLEGTIEDLLTDNPELLATIVGLLDGVSKAGVHSGVRTASVGGSSFGPVVAGDGNVVIG